VVDSIQPRHLGDLRGVIFAATRESSFRVGVIVETFDAAHPAARDRAIQLKTSRNRAIGGRWSRPDLGSGNHPWARWRSPSCPLCAAAD
jgi:hypothetical protein